MDLDGTLIYSDMLWESLAVLLRSNFLCMFLVPWWLLKGRANLKRQVAALVTCNPALLPYNEPFCEYLRAEKKSGRRLLLVSASEHTLVEQVAKHTGLFDEAMGSDGQVNLRGAQKTAALVARFGKGGYDYAGNSHIDWPVWQSSRRIIVVNASKSLAKRAKAHFDVAAEFPGPPHRMRAVWQALHPWIWAGNLVVIVPFAMVADSANLAMEWTAFFTWLVYSMFASGIALVIALLDLSRDRQDEDRNDGPLASGRVYLPWAFGAASVLLIVPLLVAWLAPMPMGKVLLDYGVFISLLFTAPKWMGKPSAH